jgi:hypothetical protein
MGHAITGTNVYPVTFTVPDDGDPKGASSVGIPFEALADRTTYLKNRADVELPAHPIRFGDLAAMAAETAVHGDQWLYISAPILGGNARISALYYWDSTFDLATHPANSPYWIAGASTVANVGAWVRERRELELLHRQRIIGVGTTSLNTGLFQTIVLVGPVNLSLALTFDVKAGDVVRARAVVGVVTGARTVACRTRYTDSGGTYTLDGPTPLIIQSTDTQTITFFSEHVATQDQALPTVFVQAVESVSGSGTPLVNSTCELSVEVIRP